MSQRYYESRTLKMNDHEIHDTVDKYQSELFAYCLGVTRGNIQAAEEIISDVFLLLVEKQDELYFDEIRAWLYRSAEIFVRRYRTSTAKHAKRTVAFDEAPEEYREENYSSLVSEKDIEKYIQDIYKQLTPEEQQLYEYRYIKKMKLVEISEIMHLPYSTLYDKYRSLEKKMKDIVRDITDQFVC